MNRKRSHQSEADTTNYKVQRINFNSEVKFFTSPSSLITFDLFFFQKVAQTKINETLHRLLIWNCVSIKSLCGYIFVFTRKSIREAINLFHPRLRKVILSTVILKILSFNHLQRSAHNSLFSYIKDQFEVNYSIKNKINVSHLNTRL